LEFLVNIKENAITFLKSHYVFLVLVLFLIIYNAQNIEAQVASPPTHYAPIELSDKYVSEAFVREQWLSFLKEGLTMRQDVLEHLGEPTEQYEEGRIIAYRLLLAENDRKDLWRFLWFWCTVHEEGWEAEINERREALSKKEHLLIFRNELKEKLLPELLAREAEYSLVIVFDEQGIVKASSLKRILP